MTQEEMERAIEALVDRSKKQKEKIKELEDKINNMSGVDNSLKEISGNIEKIAKAITGEDGAGVFVKKV